MHAFAWCLTERYEALYVGPEMQFRTVGEEHWLQATGSPGGFILATAHVGNWEIGAALSPGEARRRTHLVREEERNPQAQEFVRRLIQDRFGDEFVTHFATNDAALGLRLRAFLQEGDIVALQADRPRAGGSTVTTSLFARPFQLPRGLLALARAADVPIVPAFTMRTGRRSYDVCIAAPITVSREGSRKDSDARAAAALAQAIESAIRSHPHQWFCFRTLWPNA
jgi:KDO2-lipid IV(A) lauroyltransferase